MKKLANELKGSFTVYFYDRRGRGESGNTLPYSPEREIEDIEALMAELGSGVNVFGISSGAALALDAANRIRGIAKLVLYEAPFIVDDARTPVPESLIPEMNEVLAAGRRGAAQKMFLKLVGMPSLMVHLMPIIPGWSKMKGVAHTLPYDLQIVSENQRGKPITAEHWSSVNVPTLVGIGGKSPEWMKNANMELARCLPKAEVRILPGQTHMVSEKALAPMIREFAQANHEAKAETADRLAKAK
jgi:pimeloyl-ACP methyl ester carboxylesterase